jgi:hypothetical protein
VKKTSDVVSLLFLLDLDPIAETGLEEAPFHIGNSALLHGFLVVSLLAWSSCQVQRSSSSCGHDLDWKAFASTREANADDAITFNRRSSTSGSVTRQGFRLIVSKIINTFHFQEMESCMRLKLDLSAGNGGRLTLLDHHNNRSTPVFLHFPSHPRRSHHTHHMDYPNTRTSKAPSHIQHT